MPLVRVVRVPVDQVVHVLARMHNRLMAAVGTVVMVRLAPMNLVHPGSVKHARAHEAAERIHSGVRRSGSSSTTFNRR
jgi:hypothetical protein